MVPAPSRFERILTELKRRRVFRTAAIYAVVAWAVVQVAETAVPLLLLPEWISRAVLLLAALGLPVAVALAWAFELTDAGVERTGTTGGATEAEKAGADSRTVPRRIGRPGLLVIGLAVVAAGAWVALRPQAEPVGPLSEARVVILPFEVTGGEAAAELRAGLVRLLSMNLDGAGSLRAVDPTIVLSSFKSERHPVLDSASAAAMAAHLGAGLYVNGEVVEIAGRLRIRAALHRTGGGKPVEVEVDGTSDEAFALVDRLAAQLLARRGERAGATISSVATSSVPALKAYLAGEEAYFRFDQPAAAAEFRRALDLDSTFALAAYRLAVMGAWLSQMEVSREAMARARRHADRLSDLDRLLLDAFDAVILRGDAAEAERVYRSVLATRPEHAEALYWLGEVQIHMGPLRGRSTRLARPAFERVLAQQPDHPSSLLHLAGLMARDRDLAGLDSITRRILALGPSPDYGLTIRLIRTVLLDSVDLAQSTQELQGAGDLPLLVAAAHFGQAKLLRELDLAGEALAEPSRGTDVRATGHLIRAYAALAQGRWGAARGELDAIEPLDPATALVYRPLLALSPLLSPSRELLEEYHRALEGWDPATVPDRPFPGFLLLPRDLYPALRLYALGLLEARLGRTDHALARATELDALGLPVEAASMGTDMALAVRAEAQRLRGDDAAALRSLEAMQHRAGYELVFTEPVGLARERVVRGELLAESDREREALDWYASAADGWMYQTLYLAPSHLRRAELYERMGEASAAAAHYARFIELWRDCDPELRPWVESARERLARLTSDS